MPDASWKKQIIVERGWIRIPLVFMSRVVQNGQLRCYYDRSNTSMSIVKTLIY